MSWEKVSQYRSLIGGCFVTNVPTIIEYVGLPFMTIERESDTGQFGLNVNIVTSDGKTIAEIKDGQTFLIEPSKYHLLSMGSRSSIVEKETGRILYDFRPHSNRPIDFEVSLCTHLPNGLPVSLHPNRIKIGSLRILKPHVCFLKLETQPGASGPAIRIALAENDNPDGVIHLPRVPMVGSGSVVCAFINSSEACDQSDISGFFMHNSAENTAPCLQFRGPCYFLDLAFINFQTAIAIETVNPSEETRGQP